MTSTKRRWISPLLVVALVALMAPHAGAASWLGFRVPALPPPGFVVLQPGKTQLVQACATKELIDGLVLWPGQTVTAEYSWKLLGTSWPGGPDTLPSKEPLTFWLDNNTKLCSAGVNVKHEAFPTTGIWVVSVVMHAQLKKQYSDPNPPPIGTSVLIGGSEAHIRVDPPTGTMNVPTTMKATPVPVPPPGAAGSDADRGTRDMAADALTRKLGQLSDRIKTLERGATQCATCGDLTRRTEALRRQVVPGLPPAQAQQLTIEADKLGGEIARLEASRGLPAVQGGQPPAPARTPPSTPTR